MDFEAYSKDVSLFIDCNIKTQLTPIFLCGSNKKKTAIANGLFIKFICISIIENQHLKLLR